MRAKVRDIDVCYEAGGQGDRPLVLVHGIGSDHTAFATLQEGLPRVRTYAYDVRGHGQTSLARAEGTLDQLGEDLAGFLENVTGPADCLGFSLGGTIVLWAAARRPDLVRRAVAVATSSVVGRTAAAWYRERVAMIDAGDLDGFRAALRGDTLALGTGGDSKALAEERVRAVGDGAGYRNAAAAMAGLNERPLQPLLAGVRCPVLVVAGESDQFCPPRAARIMLEGLPQARYVEIPNVGHLVLSEAPDALRDAVESFLSEVSV